MQKAMRPHMRTEDDTGVMASVTFGLEDFITRQGGKSAEILRHAGLEPRLYEQPNRVISLKRYCGVLLTAERTLDDEYFGLRFGAQASPEGLGIVGYHAMNAPNLWGAVQSLQRYFNVLQQRSKLRAFSVGDACLLDYQVPDSAIPGHRHDAELTMGLLVGLFRQGMGQDWSPLAVHFRHMASGSGHPHREMLGCDVRFGQAHDGILFRKDTFEQTMADARPMLHRITGATLDELLQSVPQAHGFSGHVRQKIIERLSGGDISLEAITRDMNVSLRSFQRKLAYENQSFKSILDDVRREQALQYLKFENLSVSDIAYRLGYSEISAFTRAFVRWEAMAPSAWRAQYGLYTSL
jgi:AraC-like DNA-binding protein